MKVRSRSGSINERDIASLIPSAIAAYPDYFSPSAT
jgi:hypothetical protein